MANIKQMKQIIKAVWRLFHWHSADLDERLSLYFWGSRGIGKSVGVKQAARELGVELNIPFGFVDIRLAQMDPGDLTGLPVDKMSGEMHDTLWTAYLDEHVYDFDPKTNMKVVKPGVDMVAVAKDFQNEVKREMTWTKPEWFPTEGYGVIFADEFNRQDRLTYNASFELVLDGGIGRHRLPEGWIVVAAGNPIADDEDYNVFSLDDAMISRFCHITVLADAKEWIEWATVNHLDQDVVNFISMNHAHLGLRRPRFDLNITPDPRVWHKVALIKNHLADGIRYEVIAGLVGREMATGFLKTINTTDKPIDPRLILGNYANVHEQVMQYAGYDGPARTDIIAATNLMLVSTLLAREEKMAEEQTKAYREQHKLTPDEGMNLRAYLLTIPNDLCMAVLRKVFTKQVCVEELKKDPSLYEKMSAHLGELKDLGLIKN